MTSPEDLTPRQRQTLDYILERRRRLGLSPSFREIGEHLGVAPNAVMGFVRILMRNGLISRAAFNASRGLVPAASLETCPHCGRPTREEPGGSPGAASVETTTD